MNGGFHEDYGKQPINGFPRVAYKIARDADKTGTIYRRFDRLASRNLLLLEAEIAELEPRQEEYDFEDRDRPSHSRVQESRSDWKTFEELANDAKQPNEVERMELTITIREKLREYHEALAAHQFLLNLERPVDTTVKGMRDWFEARNTRFGRPQLWGRSEDRFRDVDDLVALRVPANQDRLSLFILNNLGAFFKTRSSDGQTAEISERSVARAVTLLSSLLSAAVLFGSMVSLCFVRNVYAVLGMVGGWTVLFAGCVGFLTNAKRDQIFAATAAYAAVLVVFVSGMFGGAPDEGGTFAGCNCTQIS
ncbi:hypothetical protein DL766_001709 [Monosporascus sp. MC13-8B]|uniref:DUF6594 domain-containing protein n=1 Tax=Monosporascus cannonballus TaxID=155416 RepID=A0ABY0GSS0_9PEZI|nr:hypothetical protein DL762_009782 [Monosporascus cannonballus]RYP36952.1 hypothetical protein DL766_001709 [Monosporascus sp. MC13-8B]